MKDQSTGLLELFLMFLHQLLAQRFVTVLGIGVHTSLGCRNRAMVLDETAQTWVHERLYIREVSYSKAFNASHFMFPKKWNTNRARNSFASYSGNFP